MGRALATASRAPNLAAATELAAAAQGSGPFLAMHGPNAAGRDIARDSIPENARSPRTQRE
eukprot:4810013-Pyramimonas_sp.AAC.1